MEGKLGTTAKVANATTATHVVCVYVENYTDVADVARVLFALRDSGMQCAAGALYFKTDEATLAGIYSSTRIDACRKACVMFADDDDAGGSKVPVCTYESPKPYPGEPVQVIQLLTDRIVAERLPGTAEISILPLRYGPMDGILAAALANTRATAQGTKRRRDK